MAPDGTDNLTIKNNVFNGVGVSYPYKIQLGSANNARFEHNTLINTSAAFDSKTGSPASKNVIAQNNIFASSSGYKTSGGNGCSICTITSQPYRYSNICWRHQSHNICWTPINIKLTGLQGRCGWKRYGSRIHCWNHHHSTTCRTGSPCRAHKFKIKLRARSVMALNYITSLSACYKVSREPRELIVWIRYFCTFIALTISVH